jgi:threonine dehydrogenase-like Zn-dependent dehydrogenase
VKLPYIMGHENAGWVEATGKSLQGFKKGDLVICHLLICNCHAWEARRGHDTHLDGSEIPSFMMASDMRDAVMEMDWVCSVSVKLLIRHLLGTGYRGEWGVKSACGS